MKKIILTITLTMLGALVFIIPALAVTTVSFSPASIKITSGQNFNVAVTVNPQGISNYTAKIELDYPADVLEMKSFTFGNSWIPLSQSGYDLIDNTNGVLIKTAGYPGGLSSSATFGTVSFYAKKAGSGAIKVGSGTLVLDANNQNILSGTPEIAFTVATPAPATTKQTTIPTKSGTPAASGQPTVKQQVEQPLAQVPQTSFLAAIGIVLTLGTGKIWVSILAGLVILISVAYVVYALFRRRL